MFYDGLFIDSNCLLHSYCIFWLCKEKLCKVSIKNFVDYFKEQIFYPIFCCKWKVKISVGCFVIKIFFCWIITNGQIFITNETLYVWD